MNRLLDLEEQNHDAPNDTPLRGYHPRFRRSELLNVTKPDIPRKWYLASTFQADPAENPEERSTQNISDSLNDARIRACASKPRQNYSGDRFIPCRRGYSFEAAHCLLRKKFENTESSTLDVHEQLDWLHIRHERKAFHAMMIKQAVISGLNQNKILHYSNSATQSQNPRYAGWIQGAGYKEQGIWKCTPRKKTLIEDAKLLGMPDSVAPEGNNVADLIDWSCNDMISIGSRNFVTIYDDNGAVLTTWQENDRPRVVKWSNDGSKLVVCTNSKIVLYNLEKKKSMWDTPCKCLLADHNHCMIRCVCWSLGDRHIVTGCLGSISVYASDTGKLMSTSIKHMDRITTLKFSPNFTYIVSAAQDKTVGVFIWPELTPYYHIQFPKNVKAIAWHPQMSGTLCIGDSHNGSLSLWDINAKAMTANICVKDREFCVENLVWNKLSGELVVHWTYRSDKRYTIAPVLASFDRIVDELPLFTEKLYFLKFNATHEQLVGYGVDGDDHIFWIWNFFGNEKFQYKRHVPLYNSTRRRQEVLVHNSIR